MIRRIECTPIPIPLKTIYSQWSAGLLKFNKKYQRNLVWKSKMEQELIETIFLNMPIGSAIIWDTFVKKEVVDGMQRISTIVAFINGELKLKGIYSKKIIEYFESELELENSPNARKVLKLLKAEKNITLSYKNLPNIMRDAFDVYQFSIIEIRHASYEQISDYFVKVQNQEKLKAGEIVRSMPNSPLIDALRKVEIKIISSKLQFDDKREEIIKMLVVFHGIFNGKLGLNTSQKTIINYVSNEKNVNAVFMHRLKLLIKELDESVDLRQLKLKSEMKYFFIGTLLGNEFHNDLKKYTKIISQFVSDSKMLNSNDESSISLREAFIKRSPEKFEVTTLLKGSHSSVKVMRLTSTFCKIVNGILDRESKTNK